MTNETMAALNYIGANIQIYGHFVCYSVPYRNGESITTTREISRDEFLALTYEYLSTDRVNCDYGNDMSEQSATKRFIMSRVNDQSISLGATWVLEQEWLKVIDKQIMYDILSQDVFEYERIMQRAIILYDATGKKEIYLPRNLANKIVHDFKNSGINVELSDKMEKRNFHSEYRMSYILEARKNLQDTSGISAPIDFLDALESILTDSKDIVVWRYEMLTV